MINEIVSGKLNEANESFKEKLFEKIQFKLSEMKVHVGKSMMKKAIEDELEDESDEPEADDGKFAHSFVGRLKSAEDIDNMDGHSDSHRRLMLKDGSIAHIQKGDAGRINAFLLGLKPDKRREVLDHMQHSLPHFNSIHDVVKKFPPVKNSSSMYGEDYELSEVYYSAGKWHVIDKNTGSILSTHPNAKLANAKMKKMNTAHWHDHFAQHGEHGEHGHVDGKYSAISADLHAQKYK